MVIREGAIGAVAGALVGICMGVALAGRYAQPPGGTGEPPPPASLVLELQLGCDPRLEVPFRGVHDRDANGGAYRVRYDYQDLGRARRAAEKLLDAAFQAQNE